MPLGQFGDSRSAEDGREAGAVEGEVEEVAALVVAVEGGCVGGTVEPSEFSYNLYLKILRNLLGISWTPHFGSCRALS